MKETKKQTGHSVYGEDEQSYIFTYERAASSTEQHGVATFYKTVSSGGGGGRRRNQSPHLDRTHTHTAKAAIWNGAAAAFGPFISAPVTRRYFSSARWSVRVRDSSKRKLLCTCRPGPGCLQSDGRRSLGPGIFSRYVFMTLI